MSEYNQALRDAAEVARKWGSDQVAKWSDHQDMCDDAKSRAWDANCIANAILAMQEPSLTGWQTMDSAPRDGTLIDLWAQSLGLDDRDSDGLRPHVEFRVPDAQWFSGQWCDMDGNPHSYLEGFNNLTFTGWMARPTRPADAGHQLVKLACV